MRQVITRLVTVAALLLAVVPAWAGPPTDSLKEYTDAVVKTLEATCLPAAK